MSPMSETHAQDELNRIRRGYHKTIDRLLAFTAQRGGWTADEADELAKLKDEHKWDGLSCYCGGGWLVGHRDGCPEVAALQADPEYLSGQEAVKVKPLEWEKVGYAQRANTPLKAYIVESVDDDLGPHWEVSVKNRGISWSSRDTEEDAKAAAVADYETILSAIATPDLKAGKAEVRNEALREAATTLLRQLNTMQENEKRNGSLLYHEQSPMGDTIRALATALNPGAPK